MESEHALPGHVNVRCCHQVDSGTKPLLNAYGQDRQTDRQTDRQIEKESV